MNNATKHKNILLIRSATRILNSTIESLKREFPNSRITVLAPEFTRKNLEENPNIDAMISLGNIKRISLFSIKRNTLREIRYSAFDLAVSLYNIDHGTGYSNIDCLAWASGAKNIRGYNACGTFIEFKGPDILKKMFLEKTSVAWLVINGITTVALFALITLGLLCEWAIRTISDFNSVKTTPRIKEQPVILSQNIKHEKISTGLPPRVHQKT